MRAIEAFNETKHQQSDYGIFEDGWNAAIANTVSPMQEILQEISEWLTNAAAPNERRRYSVCPICGVSWWEDDYRHKRTCWVPRLKSVVAKNSN